MKFGAIDIGSNAVRLLIKEAVKNGDEIYFRKISLTRVPLRLGEDVFTNGKISKDKQKKMIKVMRAFRYLMDVNDIIDYRACATSAMREASNGKKLCSIIKRTTKIPIEIISGNEEAELIFSNFYTAGLANNKTYLYIDVGGGSTEITLIKDNKRVKSRSFPLGTVRMIKGKVKDEDWKEAKAFVKDLVHDEDEEVIAIGTGGNINRVYRAARHTMGEMMTRSEIKKVYEYIKSFSLDERIKTLKLKPDRADVIVPASKIYLSLMKAGGAENMIVPKVGLSDGIIYQLYLNEISKDD